VAGCYEHCNKPSFVYNGGGGCILFHWVSRQLNARHGMGSAIFLLAFLATNKALMTCYFSIDKRATCETDISIRPQITGHCVARVPLPYRTCMGIVKHGGVCLSMFTLTPSMSHVVNKLPTTKSVKMYCYLIVFWRIRCFGLHSHAYMYLMFRKTFTH